MELNLNLFVSEKIFGSIYQAFMKRTYLFIQFKEHIITL